MKGRTAFDNVLDRLIVAEQEKERMRGERDIAQSELLQTAHDRLQSKDRITALLRNNEQLQAELDAIREQLATPITP